MKSNNDFSAFIHHRSSEGGFIQQFTSAHFDEFGFYDHLKYCAWYVLFKQWFFYDVCLISREI